VPGFFVCSRDAPGTAHLRDDDELLERHWSYMDAFASSMVARGPTLESDRETATGSLHVLALPSVDAAREFVAHEPNNRAGMYAEHLVLGFENVLGRTMWEYSGTSDEPIFLLIARSQRDQDATHSRYLGRVSLSGALRGRLILYGALTALDDAGPLGLALAVQARDREAAREFVAEARPAVGAVVDLEVHDWELGGRP
jgi:uncharacterized protein YciI